MRRGLLALVALAGLAELGPAPAPPAPRAPVRPAAAAARVRRAAAPSPAPALPPPPRSLAGTDVDGALGVDAAGDLVVDEDLRRFFDYFLAATGEEPDAVIRARLEAAIDARLPPRASLQARSLLARYLGCRDGARALPADSDLDARLAAVRALRRHCLGAGAAAAMFASADSDDEVALARRRVRAETAPESSERAARLDEIAAAMPEEARAAEAAATAPLVTLAREQELRAAGAPAEQIRALRAAAFGPDGAERLEALDRARAAWQARVDAFGAETAGRDAAEVAAVLERDFAPEERLRVQALQRIAGR